MTMRAKIAFSIKIAVWGEGFNPDELKMAAGALNSKARDVPKWECRSNSRDKSFIKYSIYQLKGPLRGGVRPIST